MRVYHFTGPTYGLQNIKHRRLKIARLEELNDLFEFAGYDLSNRNKRKAILQTKAQLNLLHGLICFSKNWQDPVQWGHYAQKHEGVCLGFDVPDELLAQVNYVQSRPPCPDAETTTQATTATLLNTKFAHWSYEDEYRVWTALAEEENGLYFAPFSEQIALKQVMVGARSTITRAQLAAALGSLADGVEVFQVRPAFRTFRIVRCKNEKLWA
jgi:hypothetical protein